MGLKGISEAVCPWMRSGDPTSPGTTRWRPGRAVTGCSETVVVDSITGKLYRKMPFEALSMVSVNMGLDPYSFRLDSRLLIVQGYVTAEPRRNTECSRRYYVWTGASFQFVRKVLLHCSL